MSQAGQAQSRRVTRRARLDEPRPTLDEIEARIVDPDDPDISDLADGGTTLATPEEAAAEALKLKKDADAKVEAANRRTQAAEADAARARAASAGNALSALGRQEADIKSRVTAAKSAHAAASAQYKSALENSDTDAQMAAVTALTDAAADVKLSEATATNFENWKSQNRDKIDALKRGPQQTRQVDDGPSPETRRWIGTHPLYNSDDAAGQKYRAEAMSAHELALADLGGDAEGTAAYVDFVEKHMEGIFGKNHGQIDHGKRTSTTMERNANRNSSTAAPRGEGQGTRQSGGGRASASRGEELEYQHTDGSTIRLVHGLDSNGRPYETVQGTIPQEWVEAAKISGYAKGTPEQVRLGTIKYAVEAIKIADQQQHGGALEGLATQRDGVYR